MSKISKQTLMSLRDFISDALSDPEITPIEIATAIRDELRELIEYHRLSMAQAEQTLDLLSNDTAEEGNVYDFARWRKLDLLEETQDNITFGDYGFKLNSDYLKGNKNNKKNTDK
jgi:hypothetical protein